MTMPYTIQFFPVGQNAVPTPHKMYPSGVSCVATPEEAAVWAHICELQGTIELLSKKAEKTEHGKQPAKAGKVLG